MHKRLSLLLTVLLFLALSIQSDASLRRVIAITQNSSIPAPEQTLGFRPGDDRKLASWAQVVQYFQKLAATSDRVKFEEIGKSTMGTPYEGTDPPELYHKYTGHDDNRDWYAFTQVETQLVVDKILNVWHPQIVHDIHQQGAFGSRLFLPPYMQPVEPNVPKQIVEGYTELGNYLAKEMRDAGFKGITTDSTYDAWSPSRAYSHYHGCVRIFQETAS